VKGNGYGDPGEEDYAWSGMVMVTQVRRIKMREKEWVW
jgi:hypothetical protein